MAPSVCDDCARTVLEATFALLAASWLGLRRAARAGLRHASLRSLLLDAAPLFCTWLWLVALLARPLLCAMIVLAMSCGVIWGNAAKRRATDEPLVFTDRSSGNVLLYPSLYAGVINAVGLVICIALAGGLLAAWFWAEPALFSSWLPLLLAVAVALLAWWLPPSPAMVLRWAGEDSLKRCTLDPARDAATLGLCASVILHGAIAARERPARRRTCRPGRSPALPFDCEYRGPIVMVQLESFFDARRAWPGLPGDLLPEFDRCVARSRLHGRLSTSAWGANTVRTEFAALTGLSDADLGADRCNPYAAFAREPVDSLAWRLREAGYHTVCVHPFDRRFYGRDRVMPKLGFDEFLDIADFAPDDCDRPYVSDMALMRKIEEVLHRCGPRTFVFAISIGNHSPWCSPPGAHALGDHPVRAGFLHGLQQSDAALGYMQRCLDADWPGFTLGAFGDHQPSLTGRFAQAGLASRMTDYVITSSREGAAERLNIAAHDLPRLVAAIASVAKSPPLPAASHAVKTVLF